MELQHIVDRWLKSRWHSGVAISAYRESDGREFHAGAGNLDARTPYFGTGTTKMFIATIVMQLREEGRLSFDAPFTSFLPNCKACTELHVKNNIDYTHDITIGHLMSQTSGLGDFFMYKNSARAIQHAMADGVDTSWTFDDIAMRARSHGAIHRPGHGRRARYSDTNFQLLGRVVEQIEGKTIAEIVRDRITAPLGLSSTYIYCDPSDDRPVNLMSKAREVHIPRTMASFQSDSGIVVTSREALIFLRAFMDSKLFDRQALLRRCAWRTVFYPAEYGMGLMRISVPTLYAMPHRLSKPTRLFRRPPTMFGHIGVAGTFMFYAPREKIYVAGTVNQLFDPARAMISAIDVVETLSNGQREAMTADIAAAE